MIIFTALLCLLLYYYMIVVENLKLFDPHQHHSFQLNYIFMLSMPGIQKRKVQLCCVPHIVRSDYFVFTLL